MWIDRIQLDEIALELEAELFRMTKERQRLGRLKAEAEAEAEAGPRMRTQYAKDKLRRRAGDPATLEERLEFLDKLIEEWPRPTEYNESGSDSDSSSDPNIEIYRLAMASKPPNSE
jgi:hypothetical protein